MCREVTHKVRGSCAPVIRLALGIHGCAIGGQVLPYAVLLQPVPVEAKRAGACVGDEVVAIGGIALSGLGAGSNFHQHLVQVLRRLQTRRQVEWCLSRRVHYESSAFSQGPHTQTRANTQNVDSILKEKWRNAAVARGRALEYRQRISC